MSPELPAHARRPHAPWRLESWSLRTKIPAVLLLPIVIAIVLAGTRIHTELGQAGTLSQLVSQNPVLRDITQLAGAAEIQLVDSVSLQDSHEFAKQVGIVRGQIAKLQQAAGAAALPPEFTARLNTVLGQLSGLGASPARSDPVADTTAYHDVLSALADVLPSVVASVGDDGLNRAASVLTALTQSRTDVAVERALLGQPASVTNLVASGHAATEEAVLTGQARRDIPAAFAADLNAATSADQSRLAQLAAGLAGGGIDQATLLPSLDAEDVQLGQLTDALVSGLSNDVTSLSNQAQSTSLRDTALLLGALLGALAVALLVARSVVFPIRKLHAAAIDAAQRLLPENIARIRAGEDAGLLRVVTDAAPGNNEVAQLARAFDDMRGKAVHLAGEQAELRLQVSEMFMTLSRRSQSLVESQLTVIDRLEADEQDPERLDELFRVDHLATRLRRNGENLQVLAGGRPVRHDHGPMSAVELLRAATSEVKDYRRIVLGNAPYCSVRAPAGEDVVHILAELLDNATRYSNPADKVLLTADRGADGGLLFEVVDTGLGMSTDDIEAANNRFAVGDVVSAETTRRMGLFVVGRLAMLHGVTVRLRRTAFATASPGITASVHVPGDLVVTERTDTTGWPVRLAPDPRTNGHAALDDTAVRSGDLPLDWPTPIFDRMASRWFDQNGSDSHNWSPPEVDEARKVAETATVPAPPARQSRSGLPVRVPGAQLAPGAVQSAEPAKQDVPAVDGFRRDPGAIRDNLSRHYTGMRAARRKTTNDDAPIES